MKFKDLAKLGKQVSECTFWAEEIKKQVTNDLETIGTLKSLVEEKKAFVESLTEQLSEAEKTLKKLANLVS